MCIDKRITVMSNWGSIKFGDTERKQGVVYRIALMRCEEAKTSVPLGLKGDSFALPACISHR